MSNLSLSLSKSSIPESEFRSGVIPATNWGAQMRRQPSFRRCFQTSQ